MAELLNNHTFWTDEVQDRVWRSPIGGEVIQSLTASGLEYVSCHGGGYQLDQYPRTIVRHPIRGIQNYARQVLIENELAFIVQRRTLVHLDVACRNEVDDRLREARDI